MRVYGLLVMHIFPIYFYHVNTLPRVAAGINATAWSLGSSTIAAGLTAGQAIGAGMAPAHGQNTSVLAKKKQT